MRRLADFTNASGNTFKITIDEGSVPPDSDYWGYFFVTEDENGRKMCFSTMIRKGIAPTKEEADNLILTGPLNEIKGHLNNTKDGMTPMCWPESSDWIVLVGGSAS